MSARSPLRGLRLVAYRAGPLLVSVLVACSDPARTPARQEAGSGIQPFVHRTAPDYRAPVLEPSPYPTTQPLCRATQLRATPDPDTGAAGGNILYRVVFTNVSRSACLLGPTPRVQGLGASGRLVDLPVQQGGTYFGDPGPADTAPGESGYLNIGTGTAANCSDIPAVTFRRLRFGFPDGWVDTDLTITEGCGILAVSGIGKELPPAPHPSAAPGDPGTLHASLEAPAGVRSGGTMRYTITLSNPTDVVVSLTPCPSYTQWLDRKKESLYLNCDEVETIGPGAEVRYANEIDVPALRAPAEQAKFGWSLNTPTGPRAGTAVAIRE